MVKHVKLFQNDQGQEFLTRAEQEGGGDKKAQGLCYEDCLKLYQVIMYKVFEKDAKMCEYHTYGDRFFIILEGQVSVRQPKEVTIEFNYAWDLYKHII